MKKVHNFSAGPAILPQEVIQETALGILNIKESGLSILEVSHRGPEVIAIAEEAESLLRKLYAIPEDFEVLFLSGGASSQFFMVPMNLLTSEHRAAYLDTGSWSAKAIKEAKRFGQIDVLASSKDSGYTFIPKGFSAGKEYTYCHITTNNTIYGTQYREIPQVEAPLVADSSSDFLSRPIDFNLFDIVYAGAQKNLGPAGVTVVIIRRSVAERLERDIPTMLDYRTHIAKKSMFNTPPVIAIYVSMLTMRWLDAMGGLTVIQKQNQAKAAALYAEIDRNPLFRGTVATEDRSVMNVVFVPENEVHTAPFLAACTEANISGIKGHRSVGGFRASIYNAMDMDSIEALVQVMQDFEKSHA